MLKKVLKGFGVYWLATYSLYGVSEQLKRMVEIETNIIKAKRNDEEPPKYKLVSLWMLTFDNIKEAVNVISKFVKES